MTEVARTKNEPVTLVLQRPYRADGGYAWKADISIYGDSLDISATYSDLVLYEDDIPLGPRRTKHGQIRDQGQGSYSHWMDEVYISSSDNSNPNENGRTYKVVVTPRDKAEDRAIYGLHTAHNYLSWTGLKDLAQEQIPFAGKKIFELGPGPGLAAPMAMTALGGAVYVKEREGLEWGHELHGRTACYMLDLLRASGQPFDPAPLEWSLKHGSFHPDSIIVLEDNDEKVAKALADQMDFTFSTSVLEHVEDVRAELAFLYALSKPGVRSLHVIDFQDHNSSARPLEFLTLSTEDFEASNMYRYSRGNRLRFEQVKEIAEDVGFRLKASPLFPTDPAYLDEFLPRLRASSSIYKDAPAQWLKVLTYFIHFQK